MIRTILAIVFVRIFSSLSAQIVFSEIHFNPCTAQGSDNACEFVEIFNGYNSAVDLTGWTTSGIDFVFPAVTLGPGEFYVIARGNSNCVDYDLSSFPTFTGNLVNSGETISLIDDCLNVITSVTYDNVDSWPQGDADMDGNDTNGGDANGECESLHLLSLADDAAPQNWGDGPEGSPPSPGSNAALSIGMMTFEACLLPVTLTNFIGKAHAQEGIWLSWATSSEVNIANFDLEHADDGTTFHTIASFFPRGSNHEGAQYNHVHKDPFPLLNYYRLKIVDHDGLVTFGPVVAVSDKIQSPQLRYTFPTVTNGNLRIRGVDQVQKIRIMSSDGLLVHDSASMTQVDISHLPIGHYLIHIQLQDSILVERFFKN
ncbi:MAG: lamin tail domain-containing protein [Saprospiraceae bacterium]|nr:lamin tail domain-containing protein [Saprospiraceae bacterium]